MTAAAHVWHGRLGSVVLGDTQHRVARYLEALTRHGWVHLSTMELAERLGLERSEAYRITARLRALGLFGVSNDRGGHAGGRRWWRTARAHDGRGLDPARHHAAWARVVAWSRKRRARVLEAYHTRRRVPSAPQPEPPASPAPAAEPLTFAARLRAAGMGRLLDEWRIGP